MGGFPKEEYMYDKLKDKFDEICLSLSAAESESEVSVVEEALELLSGWGGVSTHMTSSKTYSMSLSELAAPVEELKLLLVV